MPTKWKIFFSLNIVLSLPALVFFIWFLIDLGNSHWGPAEIIITHLFLFGLLLITLNGLLNIYVLQRFFPDKLIPTGTTQLTVVSFATNIVVSIAFITVCLLGIAAEFDDEFRDDRSGKIALVILFLFWIVQVFVLIMEAQLTAQINRNSREKIDSLIDSIGE